MNNFKPLVTLAVLGGIGFVVYNQLNSKPSTPPPGAPTSWDSPPQLQMPGESGTATNWNGGNSPQGFLPAASVPASSSAAVPFSGQSATPAAAANSAELPANPWAANSSQVTAGQSQPAAEIAEPYGQGTAPTGPGAESPNTFGRVESEGYGSPPVAANYADAPRANYGDRAADERWGTTDPAAAHSGNVAAPTGNYGNAPANEPVSSVAHNDRYASQAAPDDAYGGSAAPQNVAATGDDAAISRQFEIAWDESIRMLDEGRLAEGLAKLSEWYEHPRLSAAEHGQLSDLLDQVAGTVIYSTQHHLEPAYVVQSGETLEAVAEKFQVPWQLLAKVNGIDDPNSLQAGEQLKVVRGPFNASLSLQKRQLTLFLNGMYAGRFVVGIGRDLPPSAGNYAVVEKVLNPTYHGRDRTIEANAPDNPLGTRLIALDKNLSIHGTGPLTDLSSTNQPGCISLGPRDVEDVFDILSQGSKVTITP